MIERSGFQELGTSRGRIQNSACWWKRLEDSISIEVAPRDIMSFWSRRLSTNKLPAMPLEQYSDASKDCTMETTRLHDNTWTRGKVLFDPLAYRRRRSPISKTYPRESFPDGST